MTDAQAQAAVERDAELREALTDTFNRRGRYHHWFENGQLRAEFREAAFEFLMGAHAALQAMGQPGFHAMELMVASARGADFVFPIQKANADG